MPTMTLSPEELRVIADYAIRLAGGNPTEEKTDYVLTHVVNRGSPVVIDVEDVNSFTVKYVAKIQRFFRSHFVAPIDLN